MQTGRGAFGRRDGTLHVRQAVARRSHAHLQGMDFLALMASTQHFTLQYVSPVVFVRVPSQGARNATIF